MKLAKVIACTFAIVLFCSGVYANTWIPLDSCDNVTAAGIAGWNSGNPVFQSVSVITEGSGAMGLPGVQSTAPQFQRNWAPRINVGPSSLWFQCWMKPDNSGSQFATYWIAVNPGDTTMTQFNDFRQRLNWSEWRPVVVYMNNFIGRNGSPGPQVDYATTLALAFQDFGEGVGNYTTYIDDIQIQKYPTQEMEIDYMDQGFFLFGNSDANISATYDTSTHSSGIRGLRISKPAPAAADYVQETFTDTVFGSATTRNLTTDAFDTIACEIWGDGSNADIRFQLTDADGGSGYYISTTISWTGEQTICLPMSAFTPFGTPSWSQIQYVAIGDYVGGQSFNIVVDSLRARPIATNWDPTNTNFAGVPVELSDFELEK